MIEFLLIGVITSCDAEIGEAQGERCGQFKILSRRDGGVEERGNPNNTRQAYGAGLVGNAFFEFI